MVKVEVIFMNLEMICSLYALLAIVEIFILVPVCDMDLSILNPIRNYNEWCRINWFGISVITIILNIICLPWAICYWIYKLFTVGRK